MVSTSQQAKEKSKLNSSILQGENINIGHIFAINCRLDEIKNDLITMRKEMSDLALELREIMANLPQMNHRQYSSVLYQPTSQVSHQESVLTKRYIYPFLKEDGSIIESNPQVFDENALLSKGPKNLYILWDEWVDGMGGNKPARLFTMCERGKNKSLYSRRKVFWDKVSEYVKAGKSANEAIDKIYGVYGHEKSVTEILRDMRNDRQNGGNDMLKITVSTPNKTTDANQKKIFSR